MYQKNMCRFTNSTKKVKNRFLSKIQVKYWRRKRDPFSFNIIENKIQKAALDFFEDDIKHERIGVNKMNDTT
jgi:hypothetical protein